jgi:uncharacterized membrane protein YGL010W
VRRQLGERRRVRHELVERDPPPGGGGCFALRRTRGPVYTPRRPRRRLLTDVLRARFADYAAFHRTPGNRACHAFGIPIIVLASLALLARVPLASLAGFPVTLAELAVAGFVAYYLSLDVALALLMLAAYAALDVAGRFVPPPAALALFVFGWILQGVGHWVYEKNSPAFFRNFVHLAVGQLFLLAKVLGRA